MALAWTWEGVDYLFIHVPKTGGQFVRRVLRNLPCEVRDVGHEHAPLSAIPHHEAVGRRIVMGHRDPLSWYVSLYSHVLEIASRPYVARLRAWGGGSTAWGEVLYGWTHPGERPEARSKPEVCWDYPATGAGKPPPIAPGEGYWTWTRRYFGVHEAHQLLRQSRLGHDLQALLGDIPLPGPTNTREQRAERLGIEDKGRNLRDWYTPETARWVLAEGLSTTR